MMPPARSSRGRAGRVAVAALLIAASAAVARRSPAQNAEPRQSPLADTLTGAALEDYKTGRLLYDDHDYAGAAVKFKNAYDRSTDPRLLWNIAACEKNLRRYARVFRTVERYQRESGERLTGSQRAEAAALLETVRALVSTVKLDVDQAGADVFVDDERVGTTPLAGDLLVDLGPRRIRVAKAKHKDEIISQTFVGGSSTVLHVILAPLPPVGRLVVDAGGDGTIAIDGKPVGTRHWEGTVNAGTRLVRVTAPGMDPYATDVSLRDGEEQSLFLTLQPSASRRSRAIYWWIGGGAAAATAISVAAYFVFRPADMNVTDGTLSPGKIQLP
jgi:hypothetical protein